MPPEKLKAVAVVCGIGARDMSKRGMGLTNVRRSFELEPSRFCCAYRVSANRLDVVLAISSKHVANVF